MLIARPYPIYLGRKVVIHKLTIKELYWSISLLHCTIALHSQSSSTTSTSHHCNWSKPEDDSRRHHHPISPAAFSHSTFSTSNRTLISNVVHRNKHIMCLGSVRRVVVRHCLTSQLLPELSHRPHQPSRLLSQQRARQWLLQGRHSH